MGTTMGPGHLGEMGEELDRPTRLPLLNHTVAVSFEVRGLWGLSGLGQPFPLGQGGVQPAGIQGLHIQPAMSHEDQGQWTSGGRDLCLCG